MYVFNRITVNPQLPKRIGRINEIANNLWWSWNTDFLRLFKMMDIDLWERCNKNPIKFLKSVAQEKLENASKEEYKPGCKVSILGKEYPLKIKYFKQSVSNIYIDDGILVVELSRRNKKNYQEKIESLLDDVYMKIAEKEVPMAMEIVTRIVGIKPNKYRIRKIKSAWGTCSANKNITINSYLMKYDRNAIQYVVLHEICHLKYMNHSEEFWNMVEKYMKNYKEVRKKLKE